MEEGLSFFCRVLSPLYLLAPGNQGLIDKRYGPSADHHPSSAWRSEDQGLDSLEVGWPGEPGPKLPAGLGIVVDPHVPKAQRPFLEGGGVDRAHDTLSQKYSVLTFELVDYEARGIEDRACQEAISRLARDGYVLSLVELEPVSHLSVFEEYRALEDADADWSARGLEGEFPASGLNRSNAARHLLAVA